MLHEVIDAMEQAGWECEWRSFGYLSFRKGILEVYYDTAVSALEDALNGVDRTKATE